MVGEESGKRRGGLRGEREAGEMVGEEGGKRGGGGGERWSARREGSGEMVGEESGD